MSTLKPQIDSSITYETQEEVLDIKFRSKPLMIGIPKEIAFQENRIGLIPEAVSVLVANGHEVLMEHNAGEGSRYSDMDYSEAGAKIVFDKEEVYKGLRFVYYTKKELINYFSEDFEILEIENIKITRTLSIISNCDCYKSKAFQFFYKELSALKQSSRNLQSSKNIDIR